jgi:dTDP-4-amino-4,6-dideoxygalactose transaminase
MEGIMNLSEKHGFYVIEDNAQSIGSDYIFSNGSTKKLGTIGHIGTTSFYPSKNLGAYGDGGAIFTQNQELGKRIQMIANHGQAKKYIHDVIGCNSRLDAIQAALLSVKLRKLNEYNSSRKRAADFYDHELSSIKQLIIPQRASYSDHVFHQYTLIVQDGSRDKLKSFLAERGISSMIYYPLPLYKQAAFSSYYKDKEDLPITENLCKSVISLPMHSELNQEVQSYVCDAIHAFYNE